MREGLTGLQREQRHQGSYSVVDIMDLRGRVFSKNELGYGSGVRAVSVIQENDYAYYVMEQLQ